MNTAKILPSRWRAAFASLITASCLAVPCLAADADHLSIQTARPFLPGFSPAKAPSPGKLLFHSGDRLAIVGDSITEQKMYSRIIETYLTVCVPELSITARQFGWSGETAEGFLSRMTNDCLRFQPTVATTCYGMNDYRYRPYDEANARWYRSNYTAVVRAFKSADSRVVLGSPGCVGKVAAWVKTASGTVDEHIQGQFDSIRHDAGAFQRRPEPDVAGGQRGFGGKLPSELGRRIPHLLVQATCPGGELGPGFRPESFL